MVANLLLTTLVIVVAREGSFAAASKHAPWRRRTL